MVFERENKMIYIITSGNYSSYTIIGVLNKKNADEVVEYLKNREIEVPKDAFREGYKDERIAATED